MEPATTRRTGANVLKQCWKFLNQPIFEEHARPVTTHERNDLNQQMRTAIIAGRNDEVRRLLRAGADPNAVYDDGRTPLMKATFRGNVDIAKMLLRAGARTGAKDDNGYTALELAIEINEERMMGLLKKHTDKRQLL